jgi:hypothetical protein
MRGRTLSDNSAGERKENKKASFMGKEIPPYSAPSDEGAGGYAD